MAAEGAPKTMQDPAHAHKRIGDAMPSTGGAAPELGFAKPKAGTDAYNVAWNQMRRPFGRKLK